MKVWRNFAGYLVSNIPSQTLRAMNTLHPAVKKTLGLVSIGLCYRKMWRGRINISPRFEFSWNYFEIFFNGIFVIFLHHFQALRQRRLKENFAKHLFARFCKGKCKQTRIKSRVSIKPAYLTRISSHLFRPLKPSNLLAALAPKGGLLAQAPKYSSHTTPSGLNSSQTPYIVSTRQSHGLVKTKKTTSLSTQNKLKPNCPWQPRTTCKLS